MKRAVDPFVGWIPRADDPVPPILGVPQSPEAPLSGVRLAVKDVIDVAGLPTGAGNPDWLRTHEVPDADAETVSRLRAAGARVVGKTHTDELAYSLGGTNQHYGAPLNPTAPDRVTGGSSSGTASAVAAGSADLGLGTDTAGSIRVPASYCGLYGFRPTHSRVSRAGIVPLAPSFDVPGLLARDPATLEAGMRALLDDRPVERPAARLLMPSDVWSDLDPSVFDALSDQLDTALPIDRVPLFDGWRQTRAAFATVQAAEAWAAHGAWVERYGPEFGPGVAERFRLASRTTEDQAKAARRIVEATAARLTAILEDGSVLVLPSAPGPAPRLGEPSAADRRTATVALTCLASAAGAPAVSVPGAVVEGAPIGLCFVGAPGADEELLRTFCRPRR